MDVKLFSLFLLLVAGLQTASAVKIKIEPEEFTGKDSYVDVNVTCTLDQTESGAKEVMLLKIVRKGDKAIVTLNPNSTLTYVVGNKDEYEAVGYIDEKDVLNTYLSILIKTPETEDTGAYTCHLYYNDQAGTLVEVKDTANLKISDVELESMNDNLKQLLNVVRKEENELKDLIKNEEKNGEQVNEIEEDSKQQDEELSVLEDKEKEVESKVTEIEKSTEEQLNKLKLLAEKDGTEVKKLKKLITKLTDKVDKEEKEIKNINDQETEDKNKVSELEEDAAEEEEEIRNLSEKEDAVEKKVRDLVAGTKKHQKKMSDLLVREEAERKKLIELEAKVERQAQQIVDLTNKGTAIENKINELEGQAATLTQRLDSRTSIKTPFQLDVGKRQLDNTFPYPAVSSSMVAFTALPKDTYYKPVAQTNLVFPDVTMQIGTAYNRDTGVFTAPVAGIYAFHLVLKTELAQMYIQVPIYHNSQVVVKLTAGDQVEGDQSAVSVVVKMNAGDLVRAYVEFATDAMSLTGWYLSSFSGYLVNVGY